MRKTTQSLNQKQSGFTLIEIAIVMVIIGVLLGGVIKGQELVNTAKEKRIYTDFKSLQAAVFVYNDRFGKYPGDIDGSTDGYVQAEIDGTDTEAGFWAALKESGFVEGKAKDSNGKYINTNEKNAFGGDMLFTPEKAICFTQVPRLPAKSYVNNKNGVAYLKGNSDYETTEANAAKLDSPTNKDFKVCFNT